MERFKELLKEHRVAVVLAVLTSTIIAFPQVYFRIDHKDLYQDGVEAIEMLPDSPWSARVREVQDGHINLGSIYYKDGKDDPYLFQPLGSIVVAYTGKIFGLGINNTLLLSRIIYSFLTFLLIYCFGFLLSRDKSVALVSTSAILLGELALSPAGLKGLLSGAILDGTSPLNFLELTRPVNSSMIYVFLFAFLISFWLYYRKNDRRWGVVSAVMLGLNFYNYFFAWTYLCAFGGVLCTFLLLQRKWQDVRRISYVFFGALVVATPYMWNLYRSTLYPTYEDVSRRMALIASHSPQFIGIIAFGALVVFLLGFPREDKKKYVFSLSLLLTPIITLNQQIVTGKIMQSGHYHWYMHKPISVILVTITVFYLLERWRLAYNYRKLIAASIIIVCFAIGFKVQLLSYSISRVGGDGGLTAIERQKYAPVMHWLNTHAKKEAVVFANEETSRIVGIYTSLNVFHLQVAHLSLAASDERIRELMFTYYRLRGVNGENVREVFTNERGFIAQQLFGLYFRESRRGGHEGDIPDGVLDDVIADYEKTLGTPTPKWVYDTLKKYEVEYAVWDRVTDPRWHLEQYPYFVEEVTFGHLTIYRFVELDMQ